MNTFALGCNGSVLLIGLFIAGIAQTKTSHINQRKKNQKQRIQVFGQIRNKEFEYVN